MTETMDQLVLSQNAEDLLSLWHEARGSGVLPDAKFISPIKLRAWVGDISVIHLHEGERRYYVALHGENVVRHLGPNFHRQYLEDAIPKSALAAAFAPYELSIKTNQPTYSIQRASLDNGLYKSLERMIMPCFTDVPDQTSRFLVWVAPIEANSRSSSSIFVPFDESEITGFRQKKPDATSELYLLSDAYLSPSTLIT